MKLDWRFVSILSKQRITRLSPFITLQIWVFKKSTWEGMQGQRKRCSQISAQLHATDSFVQIHKRRLGRHGDCQGAEVETRSAHKEDQKTLL